MAGLLDRRFDLALISLPFANDNIDVIPLYEEESLILKPAPQRVSAGDMGIFKPRNSPTRRFCCIPSAATCGR